MSSDSQGLLSCVGCCNAGMTMPDDAVRIGVPCVPCKLCGRLTEMRTIPRQLYDNPFGGGKAVSHGKQHAVAGAKPIARRPTANHAVHAALLVGANKAKRARREHGKGVKL